MGTLRIAVLGIGFLLGCALFVSVPNIGTPVALVSSSGP